VEICIGHFAVNRPSCVLQLSLHYRLIGLLNLTHLTINVNNFQKKWIIQKIALLCDISSICNCSSSASKQTIELYLLCIFSPSFLMRSHLSKLVDIRLCGHSNSAGVRQKDPNSCSTRRLQQQESFEVLSCVAAAVHLSNINPNYSAARSATTRRAIMHFGCVAGD